MTENEHVEGNGFEVKSPWFSMVAPGKRMAELISVLCLALLAAVLYGVVVLGLDLAKAMQSMASEQRRMTCIISLPAEQREAALVNPHSWCNRLAQ